VYSFQEPPSGPLPPACGGVRRRPEAGIFLGEGREAIPPARDLRGPGRQGAGRRASPGWPRPREAPKSDRRVTSRACRGVAAAARGPESDRRVTSRGGRGRITSCTLAPACSGLGVARFPRPRTGGYIAQLLCTFLVQYSTMWAKIFIWCFLSGALDNVLKMYDRPPSPSACPRTDASAPHLDLLCARCQTPTGRRSGPSWRGPGAQGSDSAISKGGRGRGRVTLRSPGEAQPNGGVPETPWLRPELGGSGRREPSGRRRGRNSKAAMSPSDHPGRGGDVWERGGLCNLPGKSDPAKKSWGPQHLRAAKGAHLPCQVYEGKERKNV
jgi:hypothetical protein